MIKGKMTGNYEYHYEFRGSLNESIAQARTYIWNAPLDLSKGLWIVQAFLHFSLRNLNIQTGIFAEGQIISGPGVHNGHSSPTLETVSLLSVFNNVRITSANQQDLRVYLYSGLGGGELRDTGLTVFAFKKQDSRKRKQPLKTD